MRKISILIAALTLSISLKPLAAQNKKVFIIDKQTVYQEIDNFSASDAWRCAFIGKNWPQEKKRKKLPTYYSNVNLTKKVTPSVWP
ncbi:hypothetical protein ACIXFG_19985 [Bacteroides fragilis]